MFLSTSVGNVADSAATIAFAAVFLRLRCIASVPQFLNYSTSYCLQAVGDGRDTLLHAVVRELVFYIPFMVAWETGSEISPPGGDTAPMAVTDPRRCSAPMHSTQPALS